MALKILYILHASTEGFALQNSLNGQIKNLAKVSCYTVYLHMGFCGMTLSIPRKSDTVFIRIVAAATINFGCSSVRLLIEGGSYPRAATINFVRARAPLRCNSAGARSALRTYAYIREA